MEVGGPLLIPVFSCSISVSYDSSVRLAQSLFLLIEHVSCAYSFVLLWANL